MAAAAVVGGGLVTQSASAAEAGHMNANNSDPVLVDALANHATLVYEEGADPLTIGNSFNMLDIGGMLDTVIEVKFDCTNGDPLAEAESLKGIKYLGGLKNLKLCSADNVDWDNLATAPALEQLAILPYGETSGDAAPYRDAIESSPKVDISGIEKLTGLKYLYIEGVPLYDLQTIPQLTNLETLYIDYSAVKDASGVGDMSKLKYLSFWGDNVENPDVLLDFCMNNGYCTEKSWEQLLDHYGDGLLQENEVTINVSSQNVELPDYFVAYIKYGKAYNERTALQIGNGRYNVVTEGLELSEDDKNVTLHLSSDNHTIMLRWNNSTVAEPVDENVLTIHYVYTGSDSGTNPDTADNFNLGWVMGIAAVILATGSFVVRSRR